MTEGPVEAPGTRAAPMRVPAVPASGPVRGRNQDGDFHHGDAPRVVVKADLLPAISVLSVVSMLGVPLGWLWSRLAPPVKSTLTASGDLVPLLVESYHQFDALALFLLLSLALGSLTGAALWFIRQRRGPVILIAGVLGSGIAAWLGTRLGVSFAASEYPLPPTPKVGDSIMVAPEVATMWVLLMQPLAVALVYGLAASWNGLDDLGRRSR